MGDDAEGNGVIFGENSVFAKNSGASGGSGGSVHPSPVFGGAGGGGGPVRASNNRLDLTKVTNRQLLLELKKRAEYDIEHDKHIVDATFMGGCFTYILSYVNEELLNQDGRACE